MTKKEILLQALLWGAGMFAGLVALDLLRGNSINWFIAGFAAVVIMGFRALMLISQEKAKKGFGYVRPTEDEENKDDGQES